MKYVRIAMIFCGLAISAVSYGKLQYDKGWRESAYNALEINRTAIPNYDNIIRNWEKGHV